MALPNDLAQLGADICSIADRKGTVWFVEDPGGTEAFHDPGVVRGVGFTTEAITITPDSRGRTRASAYNVSITFILMQTTENELGNLTILADPNCNAGPVTWADGVHVLFTDKYVDSTDIANPAAAGFAWKEWLFKNCILQFSTQMSFNSGEESYIEVTATGRVPSSELSNLGDFAVRLTNASRATITF